MKQKMKDAVYSGMLLSLSQGCLGKSKNTPNTAIHSYVDASPGNRSLWGREGKITPVTAVAGTQQQASPPVEVEGEEEIFAKRRQALALQACLSAGCVAPFMSALGHSHRLFY